MQNENWKILTVYNKEMKAMKEELEQRLKKGETGRGLQRKNRPRRK